MFKKPGPCKSTSQTRHCVIKYPFGELSWGMVREKTVCIRNQGHAKVPLRLAIGSVSIPLVSSPWVWLERRNQGHAKVPLRLAIVSVSIPLVSYPGVWLERRRCV